MNNENAWLGYTSITWKRIAIVAIVVMQLIVVAIILWIMNMSQQPYTLSCMNNIENVHKRSFDHINVTMVTIENRSSLNELIVLHNRNMNKYCMFHGYEYVFMNSFVSDRPIYWQKLSLMLSTMMNTDCSYCMRFDSDTMINLLQYPMNVLVDNAPTCSIWIGHEQDNICALCAGVFLVKNNSIGRAFVERCIGIYDNNDGRLDGSWTEQSYEQSVINEVAIDGDFRHHVARVSPNMIQNGGSIQKDHFILNRYGDKKDAIDAFNAIPNNMNALPYTRNPNPLRICVLLTTFAVSERVDMYQKVIDAWEATGVPLFVVDSSGKNLLKTKNYCCFSQVKLSLFGEPSISERTSIQRAIDMFPFDQYDIVVKHGSPNRSLYPATYTTTWGSRVKVTGKYFIKDLVHQFQYIPIGTEMIHGSPK